MFHNFSDTNNFPKSAIKEINLNKSEKEGMKKNIKIPMVNAQQVQKT